MNKGHGGKKKLFLRVKVKYRPDFTVVHTAHILVNKLITRVMPVF